MGIQINFDCKFECYRGSRSDCCSTETLSTMDSVSAISPKQDCNNSDCSTRLYAHMTFTSSVYSVECRHCDGTHQGEDASCQNYKIPVE